MFILYLNYRYNRFYPNCQKPAKLWQNFLFYNSHLDSTNQNGELKRKELNGRQNWLDLRIDPTNETVVHGSAKKAVLRYLEKNFQKKSCRLQSNKGVSSQTNQNIKIFNNQANRILKIILLNPWIISFFYWFLLDYRQRKLEKKQNKRNAWWSQFYQNIAPDQFLH